MAINISTTIYNWLRQLKIPVSKTYIKQQLLSHPDYPSLLSITDALDELGIENAALVVDKEKLKEIPLPFLTHTTAKGGEFMVVSSLENLYKNHPNFEKEWSCVIVAAEKPENFANSENEKWLAKENRQTQLLWLTIALIVLLANFPFWNQFSWLYQGLFISSFLGLMIAVIIVQHELGITNEITAELCAAGKYTDCDAVMKSKGSKIIKWLNWGDVGVIYFCAVFLLLVFSFFLGAFQSFQIIFSLLAACSLLFTLFSVYYQWRIVRKWCLLCLAIVGLLWIQFLILLPINLRLGRDGFAGIYFNEILFAAFVFVLIAASWLHLVKPGLQKNKQLTIKNFSLLQLKNNSDVFKTLLHQQRKVEITPFENDLQLGNPDAYLQILVADNPYCRACAIAHKTLDDLISKNDIGITIRFGMKTEAAKYILRLLKNKSNEYKRAVLYDWYKWMNLEKFKAKYLIEFGNKIQPWDEFDVLGNENVRKDQENIDLTLDI